MARGLGKGLDSLIPNAVGEAKVKKEAQQAVKEDKNAQETVVKITMVEPNRKQPRKNFDEDALQELADSIKQFGLIQPILVQDRKDHYEIIAGERRWRAAKMAGLKEVPVLIRSYSEPEIMEISLIENIQREDLNPIEEAQAYKRLLEEFHLKQDEVAERVSKSRAAVTNSMRLLKLSDEVQQMLIDDMISTGHARALLAIDNPEEQYNTAQRIFDEKLSVREVEKLVKNLNKPVKPVKKASDNSTMDAIYLDIEDKLKQRLSTKVTVTSKGEGAGKIEIEFYNHEDLDRLMDLMGVKTVYNHADFRLMSKRAVEEFSKYKETNLFLRGMMPLVGYQTDCVYYDRKERAAGESKYPLKKMLALAFNGISSFSVKPISLILGMGLFIIFISLLALIYAMISYVTGHVVPGWTSLILSIWFLGGLQLLAIGMVGQYIGKIYIEVKQRPRYNIEKVLVDGTEGEAQNAASAENRVD